MSNNSIKTIDHYLSKLECVQSALMSMSRNQLNVGNEYLSDFLWELSLDVKESIEGIEKIDRERIDKDFKDAWANSGMMLKGVLAGIEIGKKEKE